MNFTEYQEKAKRTAVYGNAGFEYTVLGLVSEAGEVADIIKKRMRRAQNPHFKLTSEDLAKLSDELGDVLWYIASCCNEFCFDMDRLAEMNIDKLAMRKVNGELTER